MPVVPLSSRGASVVLADTLLVASAASFDFPGIPAGYLALEILLRGRCDVVAIGTQTVMTFNGDAGANYDYERYYTDNTVVNFTGAAATGGISIGSFPGTTAPANYPGVSRTTILDYASATFEKVAQVACYTQQSAAIRIPEAGGGQWHNTVAITRVTLTPSSGNFIAGSRATLYGLG